MDKKTILEAARKNGDRGHEWEWNVEEKSSLLTLIAVLVISVILFVIDYFVKNIVNTSISIICVTAIGADVFYKGIVYKKKWRIILGGILAFVAIVMIIARVVL